MHTKLPKWIVYMTYYFTTIYFLLICVLTKSYSETLWASVVWNPFGSLLKDHDACLCSCSNFVLIVLPALCWWHMRNVLETPSPTCKILSRGLIEYSGQFNLVLMDKVLYNFKDFISDALFPSHGHIDIVRDYPYIICIQVLFHYFFHILELIDGFPWPLWNSQNM